MLEQVMKAQSGKQKHQLYSFFKLTTRWLWVVDATPQLLYSQQRDLVPTVQVGWAPGSVWMVQSSISSQITHSTWLSHLSTKLQNSSNSPI